MGKHTYLAKATWRGTSKLFTIVARDEDIALEKAIKSKEAYGAWNVTILKEVD